MEASAVILQAPRDLAVAPVAISPSADSDVIVDIRFSGISSGTEKLLWTGEMPSFPGMGYPLIPGYEAMGEIVDPRGARGVRAGDIVFVPGANCYGPIRGLFGGASSRLATAPDRLVRLDGATGPEGALLALAATAHHALAARGAATPDLIVGHGVLGRLLARLAILRGGPPPTVWEVDPARMGPASGYQVCHPDHDTRRDYGSIYDASGDASLLNALIGRLARGGEIVLAGFYAAPISFAFPPAFMKEARLRIAAEWAAEDIAETRRLVDSGALDLAEFITHTAPASAASDAYRTAFTDSTCLKMILDWSDQS